MAHVRAASFGLGAMVSESNCHPFCREEISFCHNGEIGNFLKLKKRIVSDLSEESFLQIKGNTDSEHLFAIWMDRYEEIKKKNPDRALLLATQETLKEISRLVEKDIPAPTTINLGITDGSSIIATRFVMGTQPLSLYYSQHVSIIRENEAELKGSLNLVSDGTMVASEPLGKERCLWSQVPVNHIVHVRLNGTPEIIPIDVKFTRPITDYISFYIPQCASHNSTKSDVEDRHPTTACTSPKCEDKLLHSPIIPFFNH